jgi:hypothetical protein
MLRKSYIAETWTKKPIPEKLAKKTSMKIYRLLKWLHAQRQKLNRGHGWAFFHAKAKGRHPI